MLRELFVGQLWGIGWDAVGLVADTVNTAQNRRRFVGATVLERMYLVGIVVDAIARFNLGLRLLAVLGNVYAGKLAADNKDYLDHLVLVEGYLAVRPYCKMPYEIVNVLLTAQIPVGQPPYLGFLTSHFSPFRLPKVEEKIMTSLL